MTDIKTLGSFVWSIDCILQTSKDAVLKLAATLPEDMDDIARDTILYGTVGKGISVYNLSRFTFATLRGQNAGNADRKLDSIEEEFGA